MTPYASFKKVLDITIACALITIALPILGLIAFFVRLRLGSPVLFRQERIGKNDQPFMLYKFRSMSNHTSRDGSLLSDHERLTPFGRWLRKTSLDELPQLFNILKGEMSLVGPRPLFVHYLPHYTMEEQLRHSVLPGITGWAQINGRHLTPWDERLAMDVWYVKHQSFWLDLKILFLTVKKVLTREGTVEVQRQFMEDFDQHRRRSNVKG